MYKPKFTNKQYNKWINDNCSDESFPHEKSVPYIGWFWRELDFYRSLPIGDTSQTNEPWDDDINVIDEGDDFIGFIGNNKWDYVERGTTQEETDEIVRLLDLAIESGDKKYLRQLWDYMQRLEI